MLDPESPMAQRQQAEMSAASRGLSPKAPYIAGADREPPRRNLPATTRNLPTGEVEADEFHVEPARVIFDKKE